MRSRGLLGFDAGAEFPDEGGEFTSDGDFDFVVMHFSTLKSFKAGVEPELGGPRKLSDPAFGSFLTT